jgi:hypothetical protein
MKIHTTKNTGRLTKAEYEEYQERMDSLIAHNLVQCHDAAGRSYWQFKGRPNIVSRLEEFHLQTMVEILDKRPR